MNKQVCLVQKKLPRLALHVIDQLLRPFHKSAKIANLNKILICNVAHLGDAVIATSILPVLKEALPQAKIGFLSSCSSSCVFQEHPLIDWHHKIEHWKINREPLSFGKKLQLYYQTKKQAVREISQVGYDLAIDLYPYFPNAIPVLWQAKIPVRIGYVSGGFGPLLTHAFPWENKPQHVSSYHFELLQSLPARFDVKHLKYTLYPVRPEFSSLPQKGYLLFHMGSGCSSKDWPEEHWRELLSSVKEKEVVFTGRGQKEKERIKRVIKGFSLAIDLSDQLDWPALCTVIAGAGQVITVDSVVAHIAEAYSIPSSVILMGASNPAHWAPPSAQIFYRPSPEVLFSKIS